MKIKLKLGQIFTIVNSEFFMSMYHCKTKNIFAAYKVNKVLDCLIKHYEQIEKAKNEISLKYSTPILTPDGKDTGQSRIRRPFDTNIFIPDGLSKQKKEIIEKNRAEWEAYTAEEQEVIKTNYAAYSKEIDAYHSNEDEFEIPEKINPNHLLDMGIEISPIELAAFEPVIDIAAMEKLADTQSNKKSTDKE